MRAGGNDGVLELDPQRLAPLDAHVAVVLEHSPPLQVLHPALVGQRRQPLGHLVDHLLLPGAQGFEIDLGFGEAYPHIGRTTGIVDHFRQVQIGLGGDAPPVEADPARALGHVDQHDVHPQIRGPEGGGITARPAADHQQLGLLCEFSHDHQCVSFSNGIVGTVSQQYDPERWVSKHRGFFPLAWDLG